MPGQLHTLLEIADKGRQVDPLVRLCHLLHQRAHLFIRCDTQQANTVVHIASPPCMILSDTAQMNTACGKSADCPPRGLLMAELADHLTEYRNIFGDFLFAGG